QLSVSAVQAQIENIIPDKHTPVVIYCATGSRSLIAATFMQMMGYTDVTNMEGGYMEYRS
ncbi:MAG: sulfurtransferase, partial [Candidatus Magasanikbacteria bacterium CG_4_10_14_0_2_um_filter_41_31]